MPVCKLHDLCVTVLAPEVALVAVLTHLGAQETFCEQEGAIQKVPIASSFSFTSPQGWALAVWQSWSIHFSSYSMGDSSQP